MHPSPTHDRDFNSPSELLARASFLLCLAALSSGVLLVAAGAITHRLDFLAIGMLAGISGWLIRDWLHRTGKFGAMDNSFADVGEFPTAHADKRTAELVALLNRWEALEQERGSRTFDLWALQAVRHDIQVAVEKDPELERLFHARRRAV